MLNQKKLLKDMFKSTDTIHEIEVPFTEEEIDQLRSGQEFQWKFIADTGEEVLVKIKHQEYGDSADDDEDNEDKL